MSPIANARGNMTAPWKEWIPGALTDIQVKALIQDGCIENAQTSEVGYSSFDLTLDDEGWEMVRGSVKPFGGGFSNFLDTETDFAKKIELADGFFALKPKKTYVFRLKERLGFKLKGEQFHGQATAKSSVGRVDVLARLIVDGMSSYEGFDHQGIQSSSGHMYLEVTSMTFKVNVKPGTTLSQLRLFYGRPEHCEIEGEELYRTVLLNEESGEHDNCLRVDLTNTSVMGKSVSAFRAKQSCKGSINLWKDDLKKPNPLDFWEFDVSDNKNRLPISETNFYILRSKERIFLPRGVCVYCRAIDETIGEMRIHYAGFVHPFFGHRKNGDAKKGTPLIFEVRGHDVNVVLNNNEKLAKLTFYRMSQDCEGPDVEKLSPYNEQILKLSTFFDDFPTI
jgi:dCTP deaminase